MSGCRRMARMLIFGLLAGLAGPVADVTGIEDLDLTPSIEVATMGRIDLRTEIRPRSHHPIAGEFPVGDNHQPQRLS